jgi:hypothetical protein
MLHPIAFKRMILGWPQSQADYPLVDATVKLAELLRLHLLATFADDRSLMHVAGLPFVRELRPLGAGWHSFDVGQLAAELERSSAIAHRLFDQVVRNCTVEASFRVERGTAADIVASLATAEDIVVVIEPSNPAERVTQQFTRLIEAAFRAAASVMIVPSRIARRSGPIVAVASAPEDPSIRAAAGFASMTREKLIVMGPSERLGSSASFAAEIEAAGGRIEFVPTPTSAAQLAADLRRWDERLLVMSRGLLDNPQVSILASLRSVPVVVMEPAGPDRPAAASP